MRAKPIVVGLLLAIAVVAWFALDLGRFLTLEKLHEHHEWLVEQKNASPLLFGAVFFAVYVLITGASIPGATVLTLAAGSVFGLLWGIVLVSFASALGATIAFVVARYLLRDFVRRRFEKQSAAVDAGIKKDGIFYLLALRLVPIRALNLEQALGFIDHDELVEITPTSMRLRKKILSASRRPKKGESERA